MTVIFCSENKITTGFVYLKIIGSGLIPKINKKKTLVLSCYALIIIVHTDLVLYHNNTK